MPVFENERGTFIFNSKDLCMIEHIPQLIDSGITSFKIEGRVKNELYVATVVKAYRQAIDAYFENPENYTVDKEILNELEKVSHREYTSGFYFGKPTEEQQLYTSNTYIQEYGIVGVVRSWDKESKTAVIEQRNKFEQGDTLEVLTPVGENFTITASDMKDENGEPIESAPHAQMIVTLHSDKPMSEYCVLRKKK